MKGWINYILNDGADLVPGAGFAALPAEPGGEGHRPTRRAHDLLDPEPHGHRPAPPFDRPAGTLTQSRPATLGRPHLPCVALGAGLLVLAILARIAYLTAKAWPAFRHEGPPFIIRDPWIPNRTVWCLGAHLRNGVDGVDRGRLRVPVSARHRAVHNRALRSAAFDGRRSTSSTCLRRSRRWFTATGPSSCSRPWIAPRTSPSRTGWRHSGARSYLRQPGRGGRGFMTAGLILAVMITPIVTPLSREVLATVAEDDKNAALGMGARAGRCCASRCSRVSVEASSARSCWVSAGRWVRRSPSRAGDRVEPADHARRVRLGRHTGGRHRERVR